jgi:hypothetical protein
MAIYSLSVGVISRSDRYHATAAAAYRAGELIHDERSGLSFDYTRRCGVWHKEIIAPDEAPAWMSDRSQLWNAVEAGEKRNDAQLARGVMAALPHELSHEQRLELVRGFIRDEITPRGMVADVAIHAPDRESDERNWHCHMLLTLRRIDGDGFAKTKARDWNSKELLQHWREAWANHCNASLEAAGSDERIDHRSLAAQGIDREPTSHLGSAASTFERRGWHTDRGDLNRDVQDGNAELDQLVAELAEIDRKIAAAEQRRLDARFGPPEPDSYEDALARQVGPAPELTDEAVRDFAARFGEPTPLARFASDVAAAMTEEAPPEPEFFWQSDDRNPNPETEEAPSSPLHEHAREVAEAMREAGGTIETGEGHSWWERTFIAFGQARDRFTGWLSDRWQGFVDRWRGERDTDRDSPDLER